MSTGDHPLDRAAREGGALPSNAGSKRAIRETTMKWLSAAFALAITTLPAFAEGPPEFQVDAS